MKRSNKLKLRQIANIYARANLRYLKAKAPTDTLKSENPEYGEKANLFPVLSGSRAQKYRKLDKLNSILERIKYGQGIGNLSEE